MVLRVPLVVGEERQEIVRGGGSGGDFDSGGARAGVRC